MLTFKRGVSLKGLQPQMALAAVIVHDTYVSEGASGCVITSANDGTHKAESLHYSGQALDFRTHGLREKGIDPASLVAVIAATLGPDFDVLLEDPSTINEHIHVEWQEE